MASICPVLCDGPTLPSMPIMPLSFFSPSISLVNPHFRYCSREVHGGRESCKFLILVSNEALTNFAYDAENPSENYFFPVEFTAAGKKRQDGSFHLWVAKLCDPVNTCRILSASEMTTGIALNFIRRYTNVLYTLHYTEQT